MGTKKDIGAFIESKLNQGKTIADENLWDGIDGSLNMKKSNPKKNLFYWVAGGVILFSLGAFFLIADENFFQPDFPKDENSSVISDQSYPSEEMEKTETTLLNSEEDSLTFKKREDFSGNAVSKEYLERNRPEDIIKTKPLARGKDLEKRSKRRHRDSLDAIFTVTTKYYYFNSEDKKQMITTDKNKIDSLMSINPNHLDPTVTKETDSINHKSNP